MGNLNKKNRLLFIVWILVVLSFLATQHTLDFFVFWAYGRQVYISSSNGIDALINTWEMKGLLFKAILYGDYVITSRFSDDFGLACQFVYKAVAVPFIFALLALTIWSVPSKYMQKFNRLSLFFISCILLLTVHFNSHLQAEMWGVLFLVLSLALFLKDKIIFIVLSAIVYSLTFYLKSPIPLMGGSLIFGALLIKGQSLVESAKEIITFTISTILFLSLSLLLIHIYYPQEIIDIWNASYYQHSLFHGGNLIVSLKNLLIDFFYYGILYNPPCLLGVLAAVIISYKWFKKSEYWNCAKLVLTWIFPIIYILLSNQFFPYHYYLLIYPTLITFFLFFIERPILALENKYTFSGIGLYMVYYILFLSAIAPTNLYIKSYYSKIWDDNKRNKNVYVGCRMGDGEMLFLDFGTGAFVFNNKSYLRYFYPLPLQRFTSDDPFTKTETYMDVKNKVLNYRGEYITIYPDWFFSNDNDDIKAKIDREYELYDIIEVPRVPWSPFFKNKSVSQLYLYKRIKNK